MGGGESAAVLSLQLEADCLLLGSDDVLPGGGLCLHTLLPLDLMEGRLVRELFLGLWGDDNDKLPMQGRSQSHPA